MIRATDDDWTEIARTEPFFGVLSEDRFRSENLTPESVDDFFRTGANDIGAVAETFRALSGGSFEPQLAIDFGCGVGRLTQAMAKHAHRVVGVDVAQPMLDIAREQARYRNVENVEFRTAAPDESFDWLNSLIVFQHIPPSRGLEMLEKMLARLRPGGFISIQLTFFHDSRHKGEVERSLGDYRYDGQTIDLMSTDTEAPVGVMTMYDYDLNRVFASLFRNGLSDLRVQHTDHAGCHGVYIFGRRV